MNVIIIGASGLLGSTFMSILGTKGHNVQPLPYKNLVTSSALKIAGLLSGVDLVIHSAANTNVEKCEINPDESYRDNFLLTDLIASACKIKGIQLVYISSTGVYGNYQTSPFKEYSVTKPTTHHHRSKLLGEKSVLSASVRNIILRTGWLFGGSFDNPRNFVARRIEEAQAISSSGKTLFSNNDQIGNPTYTVDVATRLLSLVNNGHQGIFNVVNEGSVSRFEYVKAIIQISGLKVNVEQASSEFFKREAKVSNNESAINWRAKELGFPEMPAWKNSLELYITDPEACV